MPHALLYRTPFPKSPAAGYHADMPTTAQPVGVLLRQDALGPIPGVTDDPVLSLLLSGTAATLHEAEEKYLDASLAEVFRLAGSDLSNDELASHPLYRLFLAHGSRGWEDSLL
jgi:hypothetical protein